MDNFRIAQIMLQKLKPQFNNDNWLLAIKMLDSIKKDKTKGVERKKEHFTKLVDEIYEEVENG